jgi:2-dehydropantoate 2-reductase
VIKKENTMKILIFGRGVISTQYAWALEKAGNEVECYVRPESVAKYGNAVNLEIWDAQTNPKGTLVKETWPITIREEISASDGYDLILVSVNPHQIDSAVSYIAPRIGNATVLFFQNFWSDPPDTVTPIPLNQTAWGFPVAGGGFEGNTLRGGFFKAVIFATFGEALSDREIAVRRLFTEAGFKVTEKKDFRSWLWNHFILNVAMEIEAVKVGSFSRFFDSPALLANMGQNIRELIPLLKARGAKIDVTTSLFAHLPTGILAFLMKNILFAKNSIYRRVMEPNNSEFGHAPYDVLAEAQKLNVPVPRLSAVCS